MIKWGSFQGQRVVQHTQIDQLIRHIKRKRKNHMNLSIDAQKHLLRYNICL